MSIIGTNTKQHLKLVPSSCPNCQKVIITALTGSYGNNIFHPKEEYVIWPRMYCRNPVSQDVPSHIAEDYNEAAAVLDFSPKASAALSRRCLQTVLREAGNANQKNLSVQIEAVMPNLPSYIAESIDAIRNIGNFAAHPIKDKNSGEIIPVEPGEAEWNLEVLDMLFDFYYVQPEIAKFKRHALDAKLLAANKPAMK